MSTPHDPGTPPHERNDARDPIGQLLRLAGPRAPVPADRLRRLKEAAHADWQTHARVHRRRVAFGWSIGVLAAAAALLLAVRLWTNGAAESTVQRVDVASVEVLRGAVRLLSADASTGAPTLLRTGDRLRSGDGVDTSSGGVVAVRMMNGGVVRVDRGTRLRWMSSTVLSLDQGMIYVESNDLARAPALEVRTAVGVARDIGTKFEVRFDGTSLRVRVRDGKVRLSQSREVHDAVAGDELTLAGDGTVARRAIVASGPEWAWTLAVVSPFELEGRSLREFLDWVIQETGWTLTFADASVGKKAETTTLHGSIDGLGPEQALAAVLPASGVEHRLENGTLLIQFIAGESGR